MDINETASFPQGPLIVRTPYVDEILRGALMKLEAYHETEVRWLEQAENEVRTRSVNVASIADQIADLREALGEPTEANTAMENHPDAP